MIGMRTSPTKVVTMPPKAAPMMMPTAMSTTLPRIAKSLNSFSMTCSLRLAVVRELRGGCRDEGDVVAAAGDIIGVDGISSMRVGVNFPWRDYGWDFGLGPSSWRGGLADPRWYPEIDGHLRHFQDVGISVVRWFILADGLTYGVGAEAPVPDRTVEGGMAIRAASAHR